MRKVVLYIAMSLDGFIADEQGGIAFLEKGDDSSFTGDYGYQTFIKDVDTILWGYTTYHQVCHELAPDDWAYENQISYVFTHRDMDDTENVKFVKGDPVNFLNTLRNKEGKDIWICGGANLIAPLMQVNMIDEYQITIMPTILGKGISLFPNMDETNLKLQALRSENGVVLTTYTRK